MVGKTSKGKSDTQSWKDIRELLEELLEKRHTEMSNSIALMSDKFNEAIAEMKSMRTEIADLKNINLEVKKENDELKENIRVLKNRTVEIVTKELENGVEIVGVPETKEENLVKIMENITKSINLEGKGIKIKQIHRAKYGARGKRNMIVKFENKEQRNMVLENCKKNRKKLILKNIYFDTTNPFFVNELLPRETKELLNETKALREQLGIKYVWISEGNILVRRDENSKTRAIRSIKDLDNIQG